ncbi:hypothetical protein HDU93_009130 [Gonapodya sp. JEL0774]|nr:hypothetical protein HDU93_009130 [Gonapodya sp. JEL0774]
MENEEHTQSSPRGLLPPIVPTRGESHIAFKRIAAENGIPVEETTSDWLQFELSDLSLKFRVVSSAMAEFNRVDIPQTSLTSIVTLADAAHYFCQPLPKNPLDFEDPVKAMFLERRESLPANLGFWESVREVEKPLRKVESLKKGGSLGKRRK